MGGKNVLAFDFGASSGRAILATYENGGLTYREIHRFENNPVERDGTLYWDFETLLAEVRTGIQKAGEFDSIGFDTWGVDFGLLDSDGKLLQNPVHYRDTRTLGMAERAGAIMDEKTLYGKTGNQIMDMNSLFQLLAIQEKHPELLEKAKTLLFMPDLFAYMVSGAASCETSIASTSQMLDPATGNWSGDVLRAYGIPENLLLPTVPSGTVVGHVGNAKMVAVAGHDTQCAVAAVPTQRDDVAFLSCGTWSLLGTEMDRPILSEKSLELNLSNELGVGGKVNYLKNIIGLWLVQESRRQWRREGHEYGFSELDVLAKEAVPLQSFIDPDAPEFTPPGDMPGRVREFCRRTGQKVPETVGQVMRCIYDSLALKYRYTLEMMQEATGKHFSALHLLGGGANSKLLCQFTASSCNLPVIAGPVEATALGNIIIQLIALGEIKNLAEGRALIAATETLVDYAPADSGAWDKAYSAYKTIL
ncbi:MAG: rhamnulokinase family protein [Oscillospiraceae bacterium]